MQSIAELLPPTLNNLNLIFISGDKDSFLTKEEQALFEGVSFDVISSCIEESLSNGYFYLGGKIKLKPDHIIMITDIES
jgi:hypothetical protein